MTSFLGEIKRRKVFQVAAAYAVVGWLLIEVASVLLPTFQAPDWVMRAFSFAVIAGFPLALILAWAFDLTPEGIRPAAPAPGPDAPAALAGQRLSFVIQGLILLAVGFLVADQSLLRPHGAAVDRSSSPNPSPSTGRIDRTVIPIGLTEPIGNTGLSAHIAISRDGRHIVYAAQRDGQTSLYLRALDELEARVLPGTEGAYHPRFSPDGEWVVFISDATDRKLKKVSVRGGLPQELADSPQSGGIAWLPDDTILFATSDAAGIRSMFRTSPAGGSVDVVLSSDAGMWPNRPEAFPGANAVLFNMRPAGPAAEGNVGLLSLDTADVRVLIEGAYDARYVPTGHIVFMRDGGLWAVPFDLEQLELTGQELPILDRVEADGARGGAQFTFTDDGMLVYISGPETGRAVGSFRWIDRSGNEGALSLEPGAYDSVSIAPDGKRLAFVEVTAGGEGDSGNLWVYDLVRGTRNRLTLDELASHPVWTPDNEYVVYASGDGISRKRADGTGQSERLVDVDSGSWPSSFSPDGRSLVFSQATQTGRDLFVIPTDGEQNPAMHIPAGGSINAAAKISPDGHWLAYQSDASGRYEIYIRPFPDVQSGPWLISAGGGLAPVWGPDSRELFYRLANGTIMTATIEGGVSPSAGQPMELVRTPAPANTNVPRYDISPDGRRFLIRTAANQDLQARQTQLIVVHNWFEELRRLVPTE